MAIPSLHKRCSKCHQLKPLDEIRRNFRKDRQCWEYKSICLVCHAAAEAQRRAFVDRPLCACGCGEQVKYPGATYRFGHQIRVEPRADPPSQQRQSLTDGTTQPKKYEHADKRKFKKCPKCGEVKSRDEYDTHSATDYFGRIVRRWASRCKLCARKVTQDYRNGLTGEAREKYLRSARDKSLRRKYGITLEQFDELRISQGDCCAICKSWRCLPAVDHCHATGQLRAILCRKCNTALGLINEDETIALNLLKYIQTVIKKT